jgi:hypothetical protein
LSLTQKSGKKRGFTKVSEHDGKATSGVHMKKPCFNEEMLADYLEVRLTDAKRAEIESHIADCDSCLEDFTVAAPLVRGGDHPDLDPVPDRVTEAAIRVLNKRNASQFVAPTKKVQRSIKDICSVIFKSLTPEPWGEPELVPIRSSKKVVSKGLIHLKKTFKNVDAEIEIEKTSAFKALIRVKLTQNNGQHKGIRVTLKREHREISSQLFNGSTILFEDIPFGLYQLTFNRKDVILGEYVFEIKESVNG